MGIPTPLALRLAEPYQQQADFIASGGLRDGIDMIKSVILGASICGMATPFLKPAMESADAVVQVIEQIRREFTTAMFLLGMSDINSVYMNRALILSEGEDRN
ncbi:alpha-hydroxy-acid oxidizing protein [Aliamphritea spongicola]|nr:alpha-hydroxy-acid oxidizing protein [Aliamphritea spongicola]